MFAEMRTCLFEF